MSTLGDRLIAVRKSRHLTQADLGEKVGLQNTTISAIEKNKTANIETVFQIADYFGIDRNWLLNGIGNPPKGIIVADSKASATDPFKDALVSQLKKENQRLLWMLDKYMPGIATVGENFSAALTIAGETEFETKVVCMYDYYPLFEKNLYSGAQVRA